MKNFLTYILVLSCLSSCLNQKYLAKNQVVFKVEPTPGAFTSEINAYTNGNNKLKVSIDESGGSLTIKKVPSETGNFVLQTKVKDNFTPTSTYASLELTGKMYFPENGFPKPGDPNSNAAFVSPSTLKYTENRLVFQTLSIPLKIRHKINTARYKDSLPTQAETGFNAGFAIGIKRTWHTFKPEINLFGQNTVKVSATPGVFFNLGGTDVKKSTTNYSIVVDRKEAFYSYGMFLMFGFNNINIGYSIGGDFLFSSNRKAWVYQGKAWQGIVVALDIIK